MNILVTPVVEMAKCASKPLISFVARPFQPFWGYDDNYNQLVDKEVQLRGKNEALQRSIGTGAEPPEDVRGWQTKVTRISDGRLRFTRERQDMRSSWCCNVQQSYKHRLSVAQVLREAGRLDEELKEWERFWNYKINIEKLKKKVREDLTGEKNRVKSEIKDGEEALSDVAKWFFNVDAIIQELPEIIERSQEDCRNCKSFSCHECFQRGDDAARKVIEVEELLQEAKHFTVFSRETEETKYNKDLPKLKKQVEMLQLKENDVVGRIKVDEVPTDIVSYWLGEVKKTADEVSRLTGQYSQEKYNKVAALSEEVSQLLQEESKFTEVARPIPPGSINYQFPVKETFHSRLPILEHIIQKLKDNDIHMVGIHGMGGVGKTTLAKHVGVKAISDKLFGKVIFAEVSRSPDIKNIQSTVADALSLGFKEGSDSGKATKLHDQLKKMAKDESKILVILDNLWDEIKLEDVGIPKDCEEVKLLLTARSHHVLRNKMETQYEFNVEVLGPDDAWILFKKSACICDDHHLKSIAEKLAQKCGGMPLAIVTLGKALKDVTSENEWKNALQRLEIPSPEISSEITKDIYNSIILSYDYLSENLKEIFLLCCRMGTTHNASAEELLRYAIGMGKFEDLPMDRAITTLCKYINGLKDVSLLLNAPETGRFGCFSPPEDSFALHDVVCSVARAIASEDSMFNEPNGDIPVALSNKNALIKCTSITLYNISRLPESAEWNCPNLKFLYVKTKYQWLTIPKYQRLRIPTNFFKRMPILQVLHLIGMHLSPLPITFSLLVNLITLCLEDCRLEHLDAIGDMKELKILSCHSSGMKKLPQEMFQLIGMRLLDLRDCHILTGFPSEILSSLTGIEALYMNTDSDEIISNDIIDVLNDLRHLVILEMITSNSKCCRSLIMSKLLRYKITIEGQRYDFAFEPTLSSRILRLGGNNLDECNISQRSEVEALQVHSCNGTAKSLLLDLNGTGFPKLRYLQVSKDFGGSCIVSPVSSAILPVLESLRVLHTAKLEKICDSSFAAYSLINLKEIDVYECQNLRNIFNFSSSVGVLPNLTNLTVWEGHNMEEIFAIEEHGDHNVAPGINLTKLSRLTLMDLPALKGFCGMIKRASELQSGSSASTSNNLLQLRRVSAEELNHPFSLFDEKAKIPNLETLFVQEIHNVENIWSSLPPWVQNLTELTVTFCDSLKELFQSSIWIKHVSSAIQLSKLKYLKLGRLHKLTCLFSRCCIQLPSLEILEVSYCGELTFILDDKVKVPSLKSLKVKSCRKLSSLFLSSMDESLFERDIEELIVSDCPMLRYLWVSKAGEVIAKEVSLKFIFHKLTTLSLYDLVEFRMFHPGKHILEGPVLKRLELYDCAVNDGEEEGQMQQPIYLLQQVFPCLKELKLSEKEMMMVGQVDIPDKLFDSITILDVKINEATDFTLGSIRRFQNLENVFLSGVPKNQFVLDGGLNKDLEYIRSLGGKMKMLVLKDLRDENFIGEEQGSHMDLIFQNFDFQVLALHRCYCWPPVSLQNLTTLTIVMCGTLRDCLITSPMAESLRNLKRLRVSFCDNLREVIEDQVQLQNLQVLIVFCCEKLINLTGPSASLPNLTLLHVESCNGLEFILTFTLAKSLGKLETMQVGWCNKVRDVIQHEGDQIEEGIAFHHLKTLQLEHLRSLRSFYHGDLILPKSLQGVEIDYTRYKLHGSNDLNTLIRKLQEKENQMK